jgi:hypothetical protein
MSEVIFDQDGLKVIKFCGKYRGEGKSRVRYELSREFDVADHLGGRRMTLSEEQMKELFTSDLAADLCHDKAMSLLGMPPGNEEAPEDCYQKLLAETEGDVVTHGIRIGNTSHHCAGMTHSVSEHNGPHHCRCGFRWVASDLLGRAVVLERGNEERTDGR